MSDDKKNIALLRRLVAEEIQYLAVRDVSVDEDMKNIYSQHEPTVDSQRVLKMMHNALGVMDSLTKINSPRELAAVIEALIDACPIVRKDEVLGALRKVEKHERKTRR